MSLEALENQNDALFQELANIQKQIPTLKEEISKPWEMKYLRESSDKQYKIYRYELLEWWNKWWIKNKYIKQIWTWVEWTQFTDANWNELDKNRFEKWEVVYLRVPNNKEIKNVVPWQFCFIEKYKDEQNRHWKIYSYTLKFWWNYRWIDEKYRNQFWTYEDMYSLLPGRNFCDKNGKNYDENYGYKSFNKWETVYVKVPDVDVIDSIPEMTMNEINNLSNEQIKQIFASYEEFSGSDARRNWWSKYEHADKKWNYIIINGKKLYIWYEYWDLNVLNSKKPCVLLDFHEGWLEKLAIWKYDWEKFNWILCYSSYDDGIHRWTVDMDNIWYWFSEWWYN